MADNSQEIEQDFINSWDWITRFFKDMMERHNWKGVQHVLKMLEAMRERGYDKQLRAGQSMASFIVTRARSHGFKAHHGRIRFDLLPNGLSATYHRDGQEIKAITDSFEYSDEI